MKNNFSLFFILVALVSFIVPVFAIDSNKDTPIKLMTELFPPFQYRHKGKTIGISTDIVKAIQKELSTHHKIDIYPWLEAKKILDSTENTALFSMLRTPEREHQYKWVGPLSTMKMVFFKKKGSDVSLNSLDDAKKINKIGVTEGVANFEMLSNQGFKNLEVLTGAVDEINIQKLVDGEIDLWPTLLMAGLYNASLSGLYGEIEPIKNVVAFKGDLYIAFNKQTSDEVINSWQNALDKLKQEKTIEHIVHRYKYEKTDYSLFIKILIAVLFIIGIVVYHNRKLSYMNTQLHKLQDELLDQAHRDHLTGLYNRRYFSDIARSILQLGKRNHQKTGIIIIDIDKFKLINDTFGHNIGDDILKHLSKLLLNRVRASDIVARFGGDEFVVLLPCTNVDDSIDMASKIRKLVANQSINLTDGKSLKFTISLGIAEVLDSDDDINLSLIRADKALYKAKNSGRNRAEYNKW